MAELLWAGAPAKLARRPDTALQLFPEAAIVRPHLDMHAFLLNLADRVYLVERFLRRPGLNNSLDTFTAQVAAAELVAAIVANKDFEILGTGASADDVTFDPEGGIKMETDASASQQVILLPHLSTNQTAWTGITWGTDREVWWTTAIKMGAAVPDIVWAGLKLTNTATVATDADQVFFRCTNTGNWHAIHSVNGTDDDEEVDVEVAAAGVYRLTIIVDSSRVARMYINGVLVKTTDALKDAVDLIPYVGVQGNAKAITVRHMAISRLAA